MLHIGICRPSRNARLRNIVVCCDGTGNEIGENISNVLKLYQVLRKTQKTEPQQVVYYNSGVGTLARPDFWTKIRQDAVMVLGLVIGYGFDDNSRLSYYCGSSFDGSNLWCRCRA